MIMNENFEVIEFYDIVLEERMTQLLDFDKFFRNKHNESRSEIYIFLYLFNSHRKEF